MDENFPKIDIEPHIREKKIVTAWVGLPECQEKKHEANSAKTALPEAVRANARMIQIYSRARDGCSACPIKGAVFIPVNNEVKAMCSGFVGEPPPLDSFEAASAYLEIHKATERTNNSISVPCGIDLVTVFQANRIK